MANKGSVLSSYKYSATVTLMAGSQSYEIHTNFIKAIIINCDYDLYRMPIIFLNVRLNSKLYTTLVKSTGTGTISFTLNRINVESSNPRLEEYIAQNCLYFMTSDPDYNESLNQVSNQNDNPNINPNEFLGGYIGLLPLRCIGENKINVNDVVHNTYLQSLIHKYTSHMTICIEPFDQDTYIDQFIIPPTSTITDLLEYVNSYYTFYSSGYRYFRDFKMTYLVSNRGNPIMTIGSRYQSVHIHIKNPYSEIANSKTVDVSDTASTYVVYVKATDTSLKVDNTKDKRYTEVIGIDTTGNSSQSAIALPPSPETTQKVIFERTNSGNLNKINNTSEQIENSTIVLNITITESDGSIFTPNIVYRVYHYQKNDTYNGKYILSYKKELILKEDDYFKNIIQLGLRKVVSEG